jgi:hypothetical protein
MPSFQITEIVAMPAKHPDGSRAYTVNLASSDGTNDASTSDTGFLQSRTISSIAVAASVPTGLTIDSSSNTTLAFTLNLSGGSQGKDYTIDVDVTLSTSFIEPVVVQIPVRAQT